MSYTCHRSLPSNLMHSWFEFELLVQFHSQSFDIVRIKLHHTCLLPSSDSEWFHSTPNALRVGGKLYGHDSFYPRPKAYISVQRASWNTVVLHPFGPPINEATSVPDHTVTLWASNVLPSMATSQRPDSKKCSLGVCVCVCACVVFLRITKEIYSTSCKCGA